MSIKTFLNYYDTFRFPNNKSIIEVFRAGGEKYSTSSMQVRASTGRKIIDDGLIVEALEYIIFRSNRVDSTLIDKAKEYYSVLGLDISKIESDIIESSVDKYALIKVRLQQTKFRKQLVKHWDKCAVSSCSNLLLLTAGHIKPWAISTKSEKLDMYNGLLLSPVYDKLFDKFLISFNNDGSIIICDEISEEDRFHLGISSNDSISKEKITEKHHVYLAYHRKQLAQR